MIEVEDIKKKLEAEKHDLIDRFKISSISIFGSYALRRQTDESDIDILVEFSEPIGWDFFDLKNHLEKLFDKKIDLVTPRGLKKDYRDSVYNQLIRVA